MEHLQVLTIDSMNLQGCDYVKIDVEGAENLVLMGARETLREYKPTICFEYSPNFEKEKMANPLD
jgi:FkbM family methyltransferase